MYSSCLYLAVHEELLFILWGDYNKCIFLQLQIAHSERNFFHMLLELLPTDRNTLCLPSAYLGFSYIFHNLQEGYYCLLQISGLIRIAASSVSNLFQPWSSDLILLGTIFLAVVSGFNTSVLPCESQFYLVFLILPS